MKSKQILFSGATDNLILNFMWKYKGTRVTKLNLIKNEIGGLTPADFKIYYVQNDCSQDSVVSASRQTNRSTEQDKESRKGPHVFGQLRFYKHAKATKWRKNCLFS